MWLFYTHDIMVHVQGSMNIVNFTIKPRGGEVPAPPIFGAPTHDITLY